MTDKPRRVGAAKRGYYKKKKKDKKPKTPGELIREIKGGMTRGLTRSFGNLGKKLRKQRKHHS